MKRILTLILALITLTGCSSFADKDNIMNLLSSPKLSQRESEIVSTIRDHLGQDIILKYPKQGSNISPVQLVDLTSNGVEEAVVLYTAPNIGGNVRIAVLSQSEDGWNLEYDAEGYGTEIYKIVFADIDSDSDRQIVVGYTYSDSSEKFLAIYSTDNGKIKDIQYQPCQEFLVEDVTGDGISDVIFASLNADNKNTQLRLLSVDGASILTNIAVKQLAVPNARVTNIAVSETEFSDRKAIVVDYTDSYFRVYTHRVYYEDYSFDTVLDPDVVQKRWVYDYSINSVDVDGDGYIETPTVISDIAEMPENLKFMEWTNFLVKEPVRKYYGICETNTGIYFPIPDEWQNNVSLKYGDNENNWQLVKSSDGNLIVDFMLLPTGYGEEIKDNEIVVNAGTLQVKVCFDESVSKQQTEYIATGMMYIK